MAWPFSEPGGIALDKGRRAVVVKEYRRGRIYNGVVCDPTANIQGKHEMQEPEKHKMQGLRGQSLCLMNQCLWLLV